MDYFYHCTREQLLPPAPFDPVHQCQLSDQCSHDFLLWNLAKVFSCQFGGNLFLFSVFLLLGVVFVVEFVQGVAEVSFIPAVVFQTQKAKLNKRFSFCTFFSLASGIIYFVAIQSSRNTTEPMNFAIGALWGGFIFFNSLGVLIALRKTRINLQMKNKQTILLLIFFLIGSFITVIFGVKGHVSKLEVSLLLVILTCWVVEVVFIFGFFDHSPDQFFFTDEKEAPRSPYQDPDFKRSLTNIFEEIKLIKIFQVDSYDNFLKEKSYVKENINPFPKMQKISRVVFFPSYLLRKLTILSCDPNYYNHLWTITWPFLGILFLLMNIYPPEKWMLFSSLASLGLSFLFCFYKKKNSDEAPNYYYFLNVLGMISSFFWIKLGVKFLIDTITFVKIIFDFPVALSSFIIFGALMNIGEVTTLVAMNQINQGESSYLSQLSGLVYGLFLALPLMVFKRVNKSGANVSFELFHYSNSKNEVNLVLIVMGLISCARVTYIFTKKHLLGMRDAVILQIPMILIVLFSLWVLY